MHIERGRNYSKLETCICTAAGKKKTHLKLQSSICAFVQFLTAVQRRIEYSPECKDFVALHLGSVSLSLRLEKMSDT